MLDFDVSVLQVVEWWFEGNARVEIALMSNHQYCAFVTLGDEVTVSEYIGDEQRAVEVGKTLLSSVLDEAGV